MATQIMGILNLTPDSFSGDGLLQQADPVTAAVAQAQAFLAAGAHILDLGGESTRPGSAPVNASDEQARVLPVIRALRAVTDAPISIDTSKAAVAATALDAGATIINDVWAGRLDPAMLPLAAERGVPIVLMHNRSRPKAVEQDTRLGNAYAGAEYDDVIADVKGELLERVNAAHAAGVRDAQIILDPGIGFGKSVEHNLALIAQLDQIKALGYPVLLGASRKSFIGRVLDASADARLPGDAAAAVIGILRGADYLRVHDVAFIAQAARFTDALLAAG